MLSNTGAIYEAIEALQKQDYLSCKEELSTDKERAWLGQPCFIKSLEKKFVEQATKVQTYKTAGIPTFSIVRPTDFGPESECCFISSNTQGLILPMSFKNYQRTMMV